MRDDTIHGCHPQGGTRALRVRGVLPPFFLNAQSPPPGDCFICASSLPVSQRDHTLRMAKFALLAVRAANSTLVRVPPAPSRPARAPGCA